MADKTEVFGLELDSKEFVEGIENAKKSLEGLGDVEGVSSLLKILKEYGPAIGIVATAVLALKVSFDQIFEAEKINRINNLFETMTKNIGLADTALKDGLLKSANGLADNTDILDAANRALAILGQNAERLPEIMELARKLTQNFGGDLLERFNQISMAVASGNTRMLRTNGIIIDSDKALKDYARTLGVATDALTEAGRQQAILNAVLEYGDKRIVDTEKAGATLTTTWMQAKSTVQDIGEVFTLAFEKIAGPTVRQAFAWLSESLKTVSDYLKAGLGDGAEQAAAKISVLNRHLAELQEMLKHLEQNDTFMDKLHNMLGLGGLEAAGLNRQIKETNDAIRAQQSLIDEIERKKGYQHGESAKVAKQELVDQRVVMEQRLKNEQQLISLKVQNNEKQVQMARNEPELLRAQNERKLLIEQEYQTSLAKLKQDKSNGKIDANSASKMEVQLAQQKELRLRQLDNQREQEHTHMLDNMLRATDSFYDAWEASAKKALAQEQKGMTQFAHLSAATFDAVKTNGSEMFVNLGKSAMDGSQSAADIMKGFFLNALADIAQSQGALYIAMGLVPGGQEYLAAGAGLLVLSGILRSMAGASGGGGTGGAIGDVGGGGYGGSSTVTSAADTQPVSSGNIATPQNITIQVMGDYLDTDETKRKLLQLVRDATDQSDFRYTLIGNTGNNI